jgi:hypothetical protein
MNIASSIVSTVGCALFLTSCATSAPPSTPVQVAVSGSNEVGRGMDHELRDATLYAIAKHAPHARPLTVAVVLDRADPGGSSIVIRANGFDAQPRVLPSGTNPVAEGALPTVPGYSSSSFGSVSQYAELHGTYTITDEQGNVLEENRLDVAKGSIRLLLKQTGNFIASRVQSLSN